MITILRRVPAMIAVALVFILTLALNWPLTGLTGLLAADRGLRLEGASGTLTDARLERIALAPGGWPLALGPISWQLGWSPSVRLQLGQGPGAWQVDGARQGLVGSRWQITGGDMAALDMSRLPVEVDARWEGQLDVHMAGRRCVASQGALTAAAIRLLTPAPVTVGRGRLRLDCSTPRARLLLELEDGEALQLTAELNVDRDGGGDGELRGFIAASHPLADWRGLLQRGADDERIEEHFSW
ncbi:hypothetical protein [Kushneria aurantia]|uniref:General secretion pathway protein N n=1 Tax=Kushneria aurantia TaxID=504092 RepID=A0ABV6G564_9GAMM|nr:hypothetical protein [Kushneria aurantia]